MFFHSKKLDSALYHFCLSHLPTTADNHGIWHFIRVNVDVTWGDDLDPDYALELRGEHLKTTEALGSDPD